MALHNKLIVFGYFKVQSAGKHSWRAINNPEVGIVPNCHVLEQLADGLLFAPFVDSWKSTSPGAYKQKHILFGIFNNT